MCGCTCPTPSQDDGQSTTTNSLKDRPLFGTRTLADFLATAIAFVLAITIHEFAHAFTATQLGDPTPGRQGRLTLNPLSHLDPLGTILIFLAGFGWGRPVSVNPFYLGGARGMALVAFAGPLSNILLATLFALLFRLGLIPFGGAASRLLPSLSEVIFTIIVINVLLAVFNLIPLAPLDGSSVLLGLLPSRSAAEVRRIQQYGPLILMGLLLIPFIIPGFHPIRMIIGPPINFLLSLLLGR